MTIEEKAKAYDSVREKIAIRFGSNVADEIFSEYEESEDERIRKELIAMVRLSCTNGDDIDKKIAWIEKQGEQKPAVDTKVIIPKFRVGDIVKSKSQPMLSPRKIISIGKDCYWCEDRGCIGFAWEDDCEVVEQNPADKIEPKFKVGDWVVSPNGVYWHIDTIRDGRYQVSSDSGEGAEWPLDTNIYHRFTIQDAKGGDVLIDKSKGREGIFIFKKTEPSNIKTSALNPLTVLGYCGIGGAGFTKGSGWGDTANCTYYPATKEQRDLLFQKMKEASCEWDAEKKELKKIEKKPAEWSEEDDEHLERILKEMESQRQRPLNIPYWDKIESDYNWLKSLKNRYTWKPSNGQMEALNDAIDICSKQNNNIGEWLYNLREQLEKLREE